MVRIDLNSDLGEGFGPWRMGDDHAMLEVVTSANIACGFHAGDPAGLLAVLREAAARGVTVGAHVGYRDLVGFGRRDMSPSSAELVADTIYQIGALKALADAAGTRVRYVKPHGALYNRITQDRGQASDVVTAITLADPSLALVGPAGSALLEQAREAELRVVAEIFADRAYAPDGSLVSRMQPGAVLHDKLAVTDRILHYLDTGRMPCIDGSEIALPAETICVHGDTPGSVEMARHIRQALVTAGFDVRGFLDA